MRTKGKLRRVRVPIWAQPILGVERFAKRIADDDAAAIWRRDRQAEIDRCRIATERRQAVHGPDLEDDLEFADALALWTERPEQIKAHTRYNYETWYRANLKKTFARVPLSQLSNKLVEDHIVSRRVAGATTSSIRTDLVILRGVYHWARRAGHPVHPKAPEAWAPIFKKRHKKKRTHHFDPDLVEALFTQLGEARKKKQHTLPNMGPALERRDRIILEVAAATGMRRGELRAFHCSWIRWSEGFIHVPYDETFSAKDSDPRAIPIFDRLKAVLESWLGKRRDGLVFPPLRSSWRGRAVAGTDLRLVVRRAKALVPGLAIKGMHDLRHHYASWLARLGFDIEVIRQILGHQDIATTQMYVHAAGRYWEDARRRLNEATASAPTVAAAVK